MIGQIDPSTVEKFLSRIRADVGENPVESLRQLLGPLKVADMAIAAGISYPRTTAILRGEGKVLPKSIASLADRILGPGVSVELELAWTRFQHHRSTEIERHLAHRSASLRKGAA